MSKLQWRMVVLGTAVISIPEAGFLNEDAAS
jgi:hypothetical protein